MTDVAQIIEDVLNYIEDEAGVRFQHNWPPIPPHYRVGRTIVKQTLVGNIDAPQRLTLDFLYAGDDIEDVKGAMVTLKQLVTPTSTLEDFSEYDEGESIRDVTNQFSCVWNAWTTGTGKSFSLSGGVGVMTDNTAAGAMEVSLTHTMRTFASGDTMTITFTVDSVTSSSAYFNRCYLYSGSTLVVSAFHLVKTAGGFTMYGGRGGGVYFSAHEFTVGSEIDVEISWLSDSAFTIRAREDGGGWLSTTGSVEVDTTFGTKALDKITFYTGAAYADLSSISYSNITADWFKYYPSGITAQSHPVITELGKINNQWHYDINVDIEV